VAWQQKVVSSFPSTLFDPCNRFNRHPSEHETRATNDKVIAIIILGQ
jgi:hypothetical protein